MKGRRPPPPAVAEAMPAGGWQILSLLAALLIGCIPAGAPYPPGDLDPVACSLPEPREGGPPPCSGEPDSWCPTSVKGAPTPRQLHTMLWTGAEVLVWGGLDGDEAADSGGLYDAASDSWRPMSVEGAPLDRWGEAVAWTGTEMIVWGGATTFEPIAHDTGARYDPVTDAWRPMAEAGAPTPRDGAVAVWTGEELIVLWGVDYTEDGYLWHEDGARYDPATDAWRPLGTAGAPYRRALPAAAWTGTHVVIWGGYTCRDPWCLSSEVRDYPVTGGLYDPALDTWSPLSEEGAPSGRMAANAVWSGTELIVWSGARVEPDEYGLGGRWVPRRDGARYDPVADRWRPMSCTEAPEGIGPPVWAGTRMIVWGGRSLVADETYVNSGSAYDPAEDSWTSLSLVGAPPAGGGATGVWTGREVIFWGGVRGDWNDQALVATGARYVP